MNIKSFSPPPNESFGAFVRRLRESKGLNQLALAHAIGQSPVYVSNLEQNLWRPSPKVVYELSGALDVNFAVLTDREKDTWEQLLAQSRKLFAAFIAHYSVTGTDEATLHEQQKKQAWKLYAQAKTAQQRDEAILVVIESHYHRSKEGWPADEHPSFAVYASHWCIAQQAGWSFASAEAIAHLARRFPLDDAPMLTGGQTNWPWRRSKSTKARRR